MTTLEDELFAYFYRQNTVNQPRRHAEAVTRIVTDHYADRGQDVADVLAEALHAALCVPEECEDTGMEAYETLARDLTAAVIPLLGEADMDGWDRGFKAAHRDIDVRLDKARADGAQEITDRVLAALPRRGKAAFTEFEIGQYALGERVRVALELPDSRAALARPTDPARDGGAE